MLRAHEWTSSRPPLPIFHAVSSCPPRDAGSWWSSTWIQLAWCPRQPQRPPCFSPCLHPPAPPEVSRHSLLLPGVSNNTNRDAHARTEPETETVCACAPSTGMRIRGERVILILCVYLVSLPVLYWIFEQAEHPWSVPSLHFLFPLLFLRRLWSHSSSISKPNITVSTSEAHRLCAGEGYVGACGFFLKCQNSVCFSFLLCFLVGLQYSFQGKGCGGLHSKISLCLFVCLSVILPICASVWLSSVPVRLSALPFHPPLCYSPLVDSCHMCLKQSFSSPGLCCLSPSAPELDSWLCVCAYMCLCLSIHMQA